MKRHLIYIIVIVLLCPIAALAETKEQRAESPHELRIGYGDPIIMNATTTTGQFDDVKSSGSNAELWWAVMGAPAPGADNVLKNNARIKEAGQRHNVGHFFIEYQYRINPYIGVGMNTDFWTSYRYYELYNGYHDKYAEGTTGFCYLEFVPRTRFTFLHKRYVNLYAAAGAGVSMFVDYAGDVRAVNFKAEATLLGLSIGENHLFGAFEFMNIGFNIPYIAPIPTQLFTASIGYRF